MRRALGLILLAAIVVAVAYAIGSIPGTLSGRVGSIEFDTPIAVAVALLLALLVVSTALLWLLLALLRLPGRLGRRSELARRREADRALSAALQALAAGAPEEARRESVRASRLIGDTPQTLLIGAEANRAAGRTSAAETAYERLAERKDAAFLGLRGLIRLAVERGDDVRARSLVERAEKARPRTDWVRTERLALASRDADWPRAMAEARTDDERAAFATASAEAEPDRARAAKLARQAHKLSPGLAAAGLAHARRLREEWSEAKAVAALRDTWRIEQNPVLAESALAEVQDPLQRVSRAKEFVAGTEAAFESRLLLGRLSLEAGMIGEARRQAEAARARPDADRRAHLLLADIAAADTGLAENERRDRAAAAHREATLAPPAPVWNCSACGAAVTDWGPSCATCGRSGTIRWSRSASPGTLALAAPPAAGLVPQ